MVNNWPLVRSMKFRNIGLTLLLCLTNTAIVAATESVVLDEDIVDKNNELAIKRGQYMFKGACGAYCHSMTPELRDAPYLFDCDWKNGDSDEAIFKVIFSGVPDTRMPGFADKLPNGEADIWQIIAFLKANRESC